MKRKGSRGAIECNPNNGPTFCSDIRIYSDNSNMDKCIIWNNGFNEYECHPYYKSSLFVNNDGLDSQVSFTLSDYEVFGIDYENRDNINKLCKHPDIIWKYIQTKNISEESLKQINNEAIFLNDLSAIHCKDSAIRVKISQYYFKSPSVLLPKSSIVENQYDEYLREWVGDYKWKMIYRASEHGYTAKSFHDYCDNVEGPTLIVIKSSEGWIFGGYTTESWYSVKCSI